MARVLMEATLNELQALYYKPPGCLQKTVLKHLGPQPRKVAPEGLQITIFKHFKPQPAK